MPKGKKLLKVKKPVLNLKVKREEKPLLELNSKLQLASLENRVIELEGDLRRVVDVLAKDAGGQYKVLLGDILSKQQGAAPVV